MTSFSHRRAPRLAALTFSLFVGGAAAAQSPLIYPNSSPLGEARAAEARNDPAEALARYLRVLASNPRSLDALTGAGRAALDIEDPNAAVGFYGRAEEIAPRDGRVKAGLASALVQLEQPAEALRLFQAAVSLGVPESVVAGDRGLAYDLRGDNRRAQADYQLSLRSRYDPEVTRRLAVSQAIGGDRAAALQTLDPLLRQQNKAAWRTRAFVHALTGDAAGAAQLADTLMPPMQAAQMKPFLGRLSGLSPSAKAMAVHFGHFPGNANGAVALAQALPVPGAVQRPLPSVAPPVAAPQPAAAPAPRRMSYREQREQRELARTRAAEQQRVAAARDAEQRRLAQEAEQRRIADARLAEERRLAQLRQAEQQRLLDQQRALEQQRLAEQRRMEAQEAERRAAAARSAAATLPTRVVPQPSFGPSSTLSPMSAVTGTTMASTASVQNVATSTIGSAPEPAFTSLTNVMPAAANMQPQLPSGPVLGVRAVELPASSVASRSVVPTVSSAVQPAPIQLASAQPAAQASLPAATAPTVAPVPANVPKGDVPRFETQGPLKPAGAPGAAAGRTVIRSTEQGKAAAEAQVKPGNKVKGTASAKAEAKAASAAKADRAALAKKDEKGAKDAKTGKLAAKDNEDAKAKPKEPARVWVQVAGGADKKALPREWSRLKTKHGELFAGQSAWTTPLRATNRLLVGPFKSFGASQEFVNKAGKAGISSFTFTSEEGQAIEKLAAK